MCSRDGYTALQAHQLSQHHCTRHNRNMARTCCNHFRIIRLHCCRSHNRIRIIDILRSVTNANTHTQLGQTTAGCVARQIRTRHGIAEVKQHLSDPAHTGTAYTYKVYAFNFVLHLLPNFSIIWAIDSFASRLPFAYAASAICRQRSRVIVLINEANASIFNSFCG